MAKEIWVLGATGRSGRAIAATLAARNSDTVLVGRDTARLQGVARPLQARAVVASSTAAMATAIRRDRPAVVINTVGPFGRTAGEIADAALESGHYLDLANDIGTFLGHRGRDRSARQRGHTIVTGAGFGVTATESIVTRLLQQRPAAARVRVDMIPSIASTAGHLGEALAGSLVDGLPGVPGGGRFQCRRMVNGRLAAAPLGGSPLVLVTPDRDRITSALMPLGELLAAARASGAPDVESASSEAPSGAVGTLARAGLPMLHIAPLRRFATRRLAAVRTPERPAPRAHSWGHARVEWSDGTVREGWLKLGTASAFTTTVAAEVATRLAEGRGRPGFFTPAELFGTELAETCGGTYLID